MTTIVTHDSRFHTDDVFAVAVLLQLLGEAKVVRSRDPKIHATADYLVDTGMQYNPSRNFFDHHQPGGAGVRENGIPYASFGLVWKEFGEKLAGGKDEAEIIDRELVQPIDAHDNGLPIAEYKFPGVRDYAIGDFFASFVTSRDQEHLNEVFNHVVGIAKDLLVREIALAKKTVVSKKKILDLYNSAPDKQIIILSEDLNGWRETLGQTKEAVYAVYLRPDGHWSLACVPASSTVFGIARKSLPLAWGGKTGEELQKVTGVPDALFAHRGLFMASAKTKEGVVALAKLALQA